MILYAERFASTWLYPAVFSLLSPPQTPVAFEFLDRDQAQSLIEATLEVLNKRMKDVPTALKDVKYSLANSMLKRTLNRYYN